MRSRIMALALGAAALAPLDAGAQPRAAAPAVQVLTPTFVDERFEELCERLRHDIIREERAERGERAEGDRREAHEIHEHVEHLRREYAEHCERR